MKTYISDSLMNTEQIAADWLADLGRTFAASEEALVVGLSGHLGAGKTAFIKILAKLLGISETVTSPTFVLMKIYEIPSDLKTIPWKRLVHIDAYRLEKPEELAALDFENLVSDPRNLIMVEWPENVGLKDFVTLAKLDFEIREGRHHISVR